MKSSLVEFSSRRNVQESKYGNGQFTCVINNANRIDQATRILAHRIIVPNCFDNVRGHTFSIVNSSMEEQFQFTVPDMWAKIDDYVVFWNGLYAQAAAAAGFTGGLFIAHSSNYVKLFIDGDGSWLHGYFLKSTSDVFDTLGWNTHTISAGGDKRILSLFQNVVYNQTANFKTDLMDFAGEQLVYIAIREMCEGNLVASDGQQYNILAVCTLTDTPHGAYRGFEASDVRVDDIDFIEDINIQSATVTVLDAGFKPLFIPKNHHVTVILKTFY